MQTEPLEIAIDTIIDELTTGSANPGTSGIFAPTNPHPNTPYNIPIVTTHGQLDYQAIYNKIMKPELDLIDGQDAKKLGNDIDQAFANVAWTFRLVHVIQSSLTAQMLNVINELEIETANAVANVKLLTLEAIQSQNTQFKDINNKLLHDEVTLMQPALSLAQAMLPILNDDTAKLGQLQGVTIPKIETEIQQLRANPPKVDLAPLLPKIKQELAPIIAVAVSVKVAPIISAVQNLEDRVTKLETEASECTEPMCEAMGPKTDVGKLLKNLNSLLNAGTLALLLTLRVDDVRRIANGLVGLGAGDLEAFVNSFMQGDSAISGVKSLVEDTVTAVGEQLAKDVGI